MLFTFLTLALLQNGFAQEPMLLDHGGDVRTVAFSPIDASLLATAGESNIIKLWNLKNNTVQILRGHPDIVNSVAFSSNGELLASGSEDRTIRLWNVHSQENIATFDHDNTRIKAVTFSPDSRILASSGRDGQLKLWDVSTWELLRTIPRTGYYDIAFSPDGKTLVSTNSGDVHFWWVEDGARVARLTGPTGWIHPVDFSHDGTSLAVGVEDGIVRIWHIDTSLAGDGSGGVRILHVDTYLQQVPDVNSANTDNIPEPVHPPTIVREFFELDPFYEQCRTY